MHLIVLIHGMWGNIHHFDYIKDQLVAHGATSHDGGPLPAEIGPTLVYRTSSNEGYFTYDGVDVCGLRVVDEIMAELALLESNGTAVTDMSILGYSMGGVIARYAAGILETRGVFEAIRPRTFTTMFSPHLGVRVLKPGLGSVLFNTIGAWSMARTSRQVFLQDSHHNWHAPLFLHMTSRGTPYVKALERFGSRTLYANIVNDRRCELYTACAQSDIEAGAAPGAVPTGPYIRGYEPTLLHAPLAFAEHSGSEPSLLERVKAGALLALRIGVAVPLWFCAFLVNAAYQAGASALRTSPILSSGRLLSIDEGSSSELQELLEREANQIVENVYTAVGGHAPAPVEVKLLDKQFNSLEWNKVFVHITLDKNAHSAAIVRVDKPSMAEGKVVVRHWIEEVLGM